MTENNEIRGKNGFRSARGKENIINYIIIK